MIETPVLLIKKQLVNADPYQLLTSRIHRTVHVGLIRLVELDLGMVAVSACYNDQS